MWGDGTASWLLSQAPPYDILVLKLFPVLFAIDMKSLYGKSPVTCLWPVQIHYFSWGPLPPCSQAGYAAGSYAVFSSFQNEPTTPQSQKARVSLLPPGEDNWAL